MEIFDNATSDLNMTSNFNATSGFNVTSVEKEDGVYYQKSMEFIFEVVLLLAVGILGLVGNISAIVLFARLENQVGRSFFKATTLFPGGIRSHDPKLQSPRWQAETIPLDNDAKARSFFRRPLFPKISAKKLAFLTQNIAKLCKILIITLVFEKNANFFAVN
jgi:hypothetical protein